MYKTLNETIYGMRSTDYKKKDLLQNIISL